MNNTKSLFSNNTQDTYFKTIYKTSDYKTEEYMYNQLALYAETIKYLLLQFSLGNFENVLAILDRDYYNTLSLKLVRLKRIQFPTYEKLRTAIQYALQGLYKAMEQYVLLTNCEINSKTLAEKAAILDDIKKLKEHITMLEGTLSLFPDKEITMMKATVRPEYVEYIKLYGYPQGGIFDMDKLGIIIKNMIT